MIWLKLSIGICTPSRSKSCKTSHLRRLLVAHTILRIYDYLLTRKKMYVEGITVDNIHVVIYRKIMDAYKIHL